jgi:acyl carrier protein
MNEAVELVRRELMVVMQEASVPFDEVTAESSLVDDLRLDSFIFVDLTLALERAFGIGEFPMQEWVDEQARKEGDRFTIAALAAACLEARGTQDDDDDRDLTEIGDR